MFVFFGFRSKIWERFDLIFSCAVLVTVVALCESWWLGVRDGVWCV